MSKKTTDLSYQTLSLIKEIKTDLGKPEQFPFPEETRAYLQKAIKILPTLHGKEALQETYLLNAQYELMAIPIDTKTYYFPNHINRLSSSVHEFLRLAGKNPCTLDWKTGKSTDAEMEAFVLETADSMRLKFARSSLADLETPLDGRHGEGSISTMVDRIDEFLEGSPFTYSDLPKTAKSTDEEMKLRIEHAEQARHLENAQLEFDIMLEIKTEEHLRWIRSPENLESLIIWDMIASKAPFSALDRTGQSDSRQIKQRLTGERKRIEKLVDIKQTKEHALIAAALPDRTRANISLLATAAVA